jgi:hypothetical protein
MTTDLLTKEAEDLATLADRRGDLLCAISFDVVRDMDATIKPVDLKAMGSTMEPGVGMHWFHTFGDFARAANERLDFEESLFCAMAFDAGRAGWSTPVGDASSFCFDFMTQMLDSGLDAELRLMRENRELEKQLAAERAAHVTTKAMLDGALTTGAAFKRERDLSRLGFETAVKYLRRIEANTGADTDAGAIVRDALLALLQP